MRRRSDLQKRGHGGFYSNGCIQNKTNMEKFKLHTVVEKFVTDQQQQKRPFVALSLERLGESGATHDSQSPSRSGVEARVA